ncbi:FAD binding domain-containing protein [Nocardia tengchongensis]|uniref:FAD binding domain-containing protein n=1 Tax=Nocardia tengchongensis TaxID=2055889 RepID=UPI003607B8DF
MKEFAYRRATDVDEALRLAAAGGDTRFLGGGTNLVDLMKNGVEAPERLIDVRFLPLGGISEISGGGMLLGATTTNSDIAAHPDIRRRYPALSQAILTGASGQLRNMATAAGNLLQRTRCGYFADPSEPCNRRAPGSGCGALAGEHHNHAILDWSPSCVATHPSDMAVALAAFDAHVRYQTMEGAGALPLSRFYLPVGDSPHKETALPGHALITGIALPSVTPTLRSRYRKVRERASYAFATVSVAAALEVLEGRILDVRIALGGVASQPWRARVAEDMVRDAAADAELFRAAADAELSAARPLRDNAYKVTLARNLITTVLTELAASERL